MKHILTVVLLTICYFSCSHGKKIENRSLKHEVKICLIDTLDLEDSFWRINRILEKEHPERFKNPPDYSDTLNRHYITHYIRRYTITYRGSATRLNKFCVTKSDTSILTTFLENPSYKNVFTPSSYFAFRFEKNNCLDLYLLTNDSVSFKKTDLTYFGLEGSSIVVKLNAVAGERLKEFSKRNIGREVAFMIDGVIYYSANIGASLDNNLFVIYPDLTSDELNKLLFQSK